MIVSHTRTGTHLLAKLLHDNLDLGSKHYEELHYSHSRIAPFPYIHLHRPVRDVMLSIWAVRDHLGIDRSVTFVDMLRTPWEKMPRSSSCVVCYNGSISTKVCPPKDFEGTLLDRWLRQTRYFDAHAKLSLSYSDVVNSPLAVVELVARVFQFDRKGSFQPVTERVGWYPVHKELANVTPACEELMEHYQCQLSL